PEQRDNGRDGRDVREQWRIGSRGKLPRPLRAIASYGTNIADGPSGKTDCATQIDQGKIHPGRRRSGGREATHHGSGRGTSEAAPGAWNPEDSRGDSGSVAVDEQGPLAEGESPYGIRNVVAHSR